MKAALVTLACWVEYQSLNGSNDHQLLGDARHFCFVTAQATYMTDALAQVAGKIIRQRHGRSFTSVVIHSDNPALELRSSFTNLTNLLRYNFHTYNVCFFLVPRKEVCKASGEEADD